MLSYHSINQRLHPHLIRNSIFNLPFLVRDLSLFYKLFLINPEERKATQLCPFVTSGVMHHEFQKYLRPDHLGIDYAYLEDFDTAAEMLRAKKIF